MGFRVQSAHGVDYVTSDLLRARHAFSTRHGGVSTLPHTASLNLAFGRGDEEDTVRENLARYGMAVGFDPLSVVSVHSIHSSIVYRVDKSHRGLGYHRSTDMAGDGYVSTDPAVTLAVKTADCTPILLEARCGESVLAVSALHAGWKGTVGDIAGIGVRMLREAATACAGGKPVDVYAAIGPCIHPCCFEVQADCVAVVRKRLGEMALPFIRQIPTGYTLDLPGLNRSLLLRAGVPDRHIDISPDCTACHTDRYFSHRGQKGVRGTLLSVITLQ